MALAEGRTSESQWLGDGKKKRETTTAKHDTCDSPVGGRRHNKTFSNICKNVLHTYVTTHGLTCGNDWVTRCNELFLVDSDESIQWFRPLRQMIHWRVTSVCPSVFLYMTVCHTRAPAEAAGRNEMLFGRDTCVVSSNILLYEGPGSPQKEERSFAGRNPGADTGSDRGDCLVTPSPPWEGVTGVTRSS